MRSWSISAGRIFGVELRIHWTFFLLPLFVWGTEYASHGAADGGRDVALVGIIFACVIAHELGHAVVARHAGIVAKSIILFPIGGVTQMDDSRALSDPAAWKKEIRIALAGPLVNLLIAFVAGSILAAVAPEIQLWKWPFLKSGNLLRSVVWANLYLAGFNLLPAYPMDGGRVLRALFSRRMDPVHATRRAVSIGQAFATIFILGGIFLPNYWLTLVGLFLFLAAQMEERSVVFRSVLESVRLEDVMLTDFATLSPADTLEDALEKAVHSLQALRVEGNGYVQAVMNRLYEVAQKKESLASAFRKLTARNLSIIPVVEDQRLVGIVTLQNLMHSMALLAESRKLRKTALNS